MQFLIFKLIHFYNKYYKMLLQFRMNAFRLFVLSLLNLLNKCWFKSWKTLPNKWHLQQTIQQRSQHLLGKMLAKNPSQQCRASHGGGGSPPLTEILPCPPHVPPHQNLKNNNRKQCPLFRRTIGPIVLNKFVPPLYEEPNGKPCSQCHA